ncbi:MAG: hypothetical protein KDA92_20065, partial [Planctomycetales bacterium]|nr:hypothetical protein [Planctomycetales bacterium]
ERFKTEIEGHGYRLGLYDADRNELDFPALTLDQLDNVVAVKETAIDEVRQRLATARLEVPGAPIRKRKRPNL